jgi:hypothetical protein
VLNGEVWDKTAVRRRSWKCPTVPNPAMQHTVYTLSSTVSLLTVPQVRLQMANWQLRSISSVACIATEGVLAMPSITNAIGYRSSPFLSDVAEDAFGRFQSRGAGDLHQR